MNIKFIRKTSAVILTAAMMISGITGPCSDQSAGLSGKCITVSAAVRPELYYSAHVQTYGWQDPVIDGLCAGTTGQAKRLEAIKINSSKVRYRSHVAGTGWQGWKTNNQVSGTTGQAKAIEAVQIEITDTALKKEYDVFYRVHMRGLGWSSWCKNGQTAGTTGQSRRLEAIQIILIPKSDDLDRYSELLDSVITGDCLVHCTGYIEAPKVGSNGVIDAIMRALGLI